MQDSVLEKMSIFFKSAYNAILFKFPVVFLVKTHLTLKFIWYKDLITAKKFMGKKTEFFLLKFSHSNWRRHGIFRDR